MIPFLKKNKDGKKPPKSTVPRTAQQSIPMQRMFEDGTCRVKPNYYTRTIQYQDINYQLAQQEDKTAIFEEWCSFLNFFDSSIKFELSFVNMATDSTEFEKSITTIDSIFAFRRKCFATTPANKAGALCKPLLSLAFPVAKFSARVVVTIFFRFDNCIKRFSAALTDDFSHRVHILIFSSRLLFRKIKRFRLITRYIPFREPKFSQSMTLIPSCLAISKGSLEPQRFTSFSPTRESCSAFIIPPPVYSIAKSVYDKYH